MRGYDVAEGRNEEPGSAACGIKDRLAELRIDGGDDKIDDMPRSAELAVVGLGAHRL